MKLRSGPSGPRFEGQNVDDVLLWKGATRGWEPGPVPGGGGGVCAPPSRTRYVDAATSTPLADQNGSICTPYATITQAMQDLMALVAGPPSAINIFPGDYSAEVLPTWTGKNLTLAAAVGSWISFAGAGNQVLVPSITNQHGEDNTLQICGIQCLGAVDWSWMNAIQSNLGGIVAVANLLKGFGSGLYEPNLTAGGLFWQGGDISATEHTIQLASNSQISCCNIEVTEIAFSGPPKVLSADPMSAYFLGSTILTNATLLLLAPP